MMADHVMVLLIAGRWRFAGSVDHRNVRILDVLNEANSEFIRIRDANVFRDSQAERTVKLDEAAVPKSIVDCIVLLEEEHEAPLRRRYGYVEKEPHPAFAVLAEHEIRGTAMSKGPVDPGSALSNGAPIWFPVIRATVSSACGSGPRVSAPVVFVNRRKVFLLQVGRQARGPEAEADSRTGGTRSNWRN